MTSSPEAGSRPLRRLLPFVMANKRDVALSVGAALAGSLLFGIVPVAQKVIVDGGIVHHDRAIWPWLLALVLIGLVTFGLAFVRRWFGGRVSLSVQHQLRTAIFDRLMRLDFAGHDQLRTGQLVSRASSDLGLIQLFDPAQDTGNFLGQRRQAFLRLGDPRQPGDLANGLHIDGHTIPPEIQGVG